MAAGVRVTVLAPDDILAEFGAGALLRVESATTSGGSYTEVTTAEVETDKFSYEIPDPDYVTPTWYRVRYSKASPSVAADFSGYGPPFSPDFPLAYASLDDLMLTMGQPTQDTRFWANAEQRLADASRDLDREIGYSALHTTGTRLAHGDGTGLLHVHNGIVSLTSVEIRTETGGSWIVLPVQDTGWYLEGDLDDPNASGGIYYHVRLSDVATYRLFPNVRNGIRLTGTFGGDANSRRAATVGWARQRIALDPAHSGGLMSGPEDLGAVVSFDKWPRAVYDLIASERHRFWCHV